MVFVHAAGIALSAWLLLGSGIEVVGEWFGEDWERGDSTRCALIFACAVFYFARLTFGIFYLIQRRMGWAEVGSVAPFTVVFHGLFAFFGARATAGVDWLDGVAIGLYLLGSYFNTGSELGRHLWKKHPENKGKIYTEGLFSLSMHINYFGDSVLFTGYAILTCSWWSGIIPALMTVMFVFMHIPMLDKYLAERYGEQFDAYAARTKKLIPFVY
jgi:protein-S-isoprenylcysteine O-methyltransferase Ste14